MLVVSGGLLGATRGRFWSIAPDVNSDEDSDDGGEERSPAVCSIESLVAYCKTPEEEACTLSFATSSVVLRREKKKIRQREAAIRLRSGMKSSSRSSLSSGSKFSSFSGAVQSRKVRIQSHVLSPTMFLLESFDVAEWVVVQRRRRKQQCGCR
jgi:hypothetical protein